MKINNTTHVDSENLSSQTPENLSSQTPENLSSQTKKTSKISSLRNQLMIVFTALGIA
jgi:site-specific recombinase XerD